VSGAPLTSTDTRITILVNNQAGEGLVAEHGLSLWIETEGKRILFDTGQGSALENNARALDIDLGTTDILVLSHGHYDHTGGIPHVLQQTRYTDVYCHSGVILSRYSLSNGVPRPIQMPRESKAAMDALPFDRLHWVQQPVLLTDKIGITGPIPRKTDFEDTGGPFYLDPQGKRTDPIEDDLALWIRTNDGVIVCVGCSHSGLVNTLSYVQHLNHGRKIRAVLGGFHLLHANRGRLDKTIAALQRIEPDLIVPCHCTGDSAVALLQNAFGKRISPGMAGTTFHF